MKKVTEFKKNKLNSLGERIRAERTSKGISQEELASKVYLTRQHINYFETDNRKPDIDKLISIADALNVSIDYLLGRIESKEIKNIEISKKTGLSDISIKKLSSFNNTYFNQDVFYGCLDNYQDFYTIINNIIENDNFKVLIYFIRAYINSFKQEELKKEIVEYNASPELLYEYFYQDEDDKTHDAFGYNNTYKYSETDIMHYQISRIFQIIIDEVTNNLKDSFSNRWSLNKEKTKITKFCYDGSNKLPEYEGLGIGANKKGGLKKNGSSRTNKK